MGPKINNQMLQMHVQWKREGLFEDKYTQTTGDDLIERCIRRITVVDFVQPNI